MVLSIKYCLGGNHLKQFRLRLFWLQTTCGNAFSKKWVFGCYWKLGQTENVFSVDCKIRATGCKIFSVVIFTSNHFRRRAKRETGRERRTHRSANTERERERERERSCRWTHDRADQIAVLAPSTRRWVLCSSKHHQDSTLAPQHQRDRSTSKCSDPSSMSSDPHDPPMPDLFLSWSTSPFPSLVDHSLFLLLSVWPSFWC